MNSIAAWLVDRLFIKQPRLRRAVTWALEGDRDKNIQVLGTVLNVNSIREHGYLRASRMTARSGLFRDELPVIINLAFLLADGDTFVDVGANVGLYSHTIARFASIAPSLKIYAFEAHSGTFARLARAAPPGVQLRQGAVSDSDGVLEFCEGAVSHVFTTSQKAKGSYAIKGSTILVNSFTLDSCDIDGDSIVMKIDVEGQELQVLLGARAYFESGRVKAVYVDGYEDHAVEDFLRRYGFEFFDGHSLLPVEGDVYSLLAINPRRYFGLEPGMRR